MMTETVKTVREGLLLSGEFSDMARELVRHLDSREFVERDPHRTRRSDGSIVVTMGENSAERLQIRLNAYSLAQSAVLELLISEPQVSAVSLMIRPRAMGGDDRSEVAIPQRIAMDSLPKVGNILLAACVCVGRGQVEPLISSGSQRASFDLFLPSSNPLPHFDAEYRVIGLSPLY